MDFEFTEEQKMLKDMAYRFAKANFTPVSQECDEQERYTPEIRKKAAENGLVGAWVPEEYGGAGAGSLGNAIISEELSRVDMGIGLNITAAAFGCEAILQYGSEEQKKSWLPPVCAGEQVSAGGVYGAQRRDRRGRLQDPGRQGRGRLRDQRQQDVHHQRQRL